MKNTNICKVGHPSNIQKWMTRIASTGIFLCHTLIIIIEKDYIAINRWFELSVFPTFTFISKFRSQIHLKIWSEKDKYLSNESPFQYTEMENKESNYWYITLS